MSTSSNFTPAFDLVPKSWELVKKHRTIVATVFAVPVLFNLLSIFNGDRSVSSTEMLNARDLTAAAFGVGAGLAVIFLVIGMVFQVMALFLEVRVVTGKKDIELNDLWEAAQKYFFRLIGLVFVLSLLVLGGLILLILPVFFVITRVFLAPYVMIDEDLGIVDSIKRSNELTKGNWKPIWTMIGVLLLFTIVPSLAVFGTVGQLVAVFVGIALTFVPALRYVELKKAYNK